MEFRGYSTLDSYLAAKLKHLKNKIKAWRRLDYPKELADLRKIKDRLQELDLSAQSRVLRNNKISKRRNLFQKIVETEKNNAQDLKQKSRINWVVDGDENSKFFHAFFNNNKRKNRINGLLINGEWKTEPDAI